MLPAALHSHPEVIILNIALMLLMEYLTSFFILGLYFLTQMGLGWVLLPSAASGYTAHSHGTGPTADLPEQHLERKSLHSLHCLGTENTF